MSKTFEEIIADRLKNPRARVYLPELLKYVSKLETQEEQVAAFRAYANKNEEHLNAIKDLMQCLYHPAVVMDLPEGDPPYNTDFKDYTFAPMTLSKCLRKISYFVKGHSKYAQSALKREQIFVQMLETLYIDDAKLFIMIKDKKIDKRVYRGVDEDLFRAAFAGWLPPKENPTQESAKS